MSVRVLLEYTAKAKRVADVEAAAESLVEASRAREAELSRHEAYRIEGTRTFVHVLEFEDGLAARDHRNSDHVREFTEAVEGALEGDMDVRELEPVEP